jgi:Tol biopolymer transport system component
MRLEVKNNLNLQRMAGSVVLCSAVLLAGCEGGGRSTTMNVQPTKAQSVAEMNNNDVDSAQADYDARIASRLGQPIPAGSPAKSVSNEYRQVAMFGEVPNSTAASFDAQPSQSIQQHTFATEGACFDPKLSPDGKWMVFSSTQYTIKPDIYVKQVNSTSITQLTNHPSSDVQPTFDNTARRIAFCSDRTGNWDIFIVDGNGKNLQQLTDDPAAEMHPSFSSDGRKLAYSRYNMQSRQWEIWLMDLSNSGQRKYIAVGLFPNFSPTSNAIVYQRATQRGSQLFSAWVISLGRDDQPSMPTEVAAASDRAIIGPQWSADGQKIVYCSVRPNSKGPAIDSQIWIVNADGQGRMPVTDQGVACFSPVWGADSRIYFCANRGQCENIWSVKPVTVGEDIATATVEVPAGDEVAEAAPIEKNTSTREAVHAPIAQNVEDVSYHEAGLKANSPVRLDSQATVEVPEE